MIAFVDENGRTNLRWSCVDGDNKIKARVMIERALKKAIISECELRKLKVPEELTKTGFMATWFNRGDYEVAAIDFEGIIGMETHVIYNEDNNSCIIETSGTQPEPSQQIFRIGDQIAYEVLSLSPEEVLRQMLSPNNSKKRVS